MATFRVEPRYEFRVEATEPKVLDFDSECRPMHYSEWRAESQITAIAWSWMDEDDVFCRVLNQDLSNERSMLEDFLAAYEEADIVTGHYIRRHDLPLLNDHCIRLGFQLKPKLTADTQADLGKVKGLGKSQDNLSSTFKLSAAKHHMSGADWRVANALTPEGRASSQKRVMDDVIQHKGIYQELRPLLGPPKMWRP